MLFTDQSKQMETLFRFLRTYQSIFLFIALEVASLALYFSYNDYQHGKYLNASNAVSGKMLQTREQVTRYASLDQVNNQLAQENAQLRAQLLATKRALDFYREDSTFKKRDLIAKANKYTFVPATVISTNLSRSHNHLVIDKGSNDGIRPEMGVINQGGVVGIVSAVSEHFALVMPLLNTSTHISARIHGKSQTGTLQWDGSDHRYASLDEIPNYISVAEGDTVETSGFSSIFPEGTPIGRVHQVSAGETQMLAIDVKLGADFTRLGNVDVIDFAHAAEMKEIEKKEGKGNE